MAQRRFVIPLALLLGATTAVVSCTDPSPVGVGMSAPGAPLPNATLSTTSKNTGLITCSQAYDSVTKVIGPGGGTLAVGAHQLWVDSLSLTGPVSITAVAPKGRVRVVRFRPEGLVFQPGFYANAYGLTAGAALLTTYKDCGVPTGSTIRLAQVSDAMSILGYLTQISQPPWTQANQYVGLLPHFSNYAVAW